MNNNKLTGERMNLDTAIAHADERAAELSGPCSTEHAQLASWLRELQERRKADSAEPIYQWRERYEEGSLWDDCTKAQYDGFAEKTDCEVRILYTAPPAPVVPDERASFNTWNNDTDCPLAGLTVKQAAWMAWLKRSGTIKSFGNDEEIEPVSNRDELPLDYLQGHKDGLEWAAQMAEANHPQTGDWLYDDPIELAKTIRKGPDMPESRTEIAEKDDNFYSWFGRFWIENYQQKNYTTSAKQTLGTLAEFAYRAGRDSAIQAGNSPVTPDCWCRTCRPVTMSDMRFVVCPDCGNKRCPHANDHRNACTGSNEPGQIGSAYPAAPQQEVK